MCARVYQASGTEAIRMLDEGAHLVRELPNPEPGTNRKPNYCQWFDMELIYSPYTLKVA